MKPISKKIRYTINELNNLGNKITFCDNINDLIKTLNHNYKIN